MTRDENFISPQDAAALWKALRPSERDLLTSVARSNSGRMTFHAGEHGRAWKRLAEERLIRRGRESRRYKMSVSPRGIAVLQAGGVDPRPPGTMSREEVSARNATEVHASEPPPVGRGALLVEGGDVMATATAKEGCPHDAATRRMAPAPHGGDGLVCVQCRTDELTPSELAAIMRYDARKFGRASGKVLAAGGLMPRATSGYFTKLGAAVCDELHARQRAAEQEERERLLPKRLREVVASTPEPLPAIEVGGLVVTRDSNTTLVVATPTGAKFRLRANERGCLEIHAFEHVPTRMTINILSANDIEVSA